MNGDMALLCGLLFVYECDNVYHERYTLQHTGHTVEGAAIAMETLTVPGNLESLSTIAHYVLSAAEQARLDKKAAYRLRLAVDEIATNIIVHGYEGAGVEGSIEVTASMNDQALTITLKDTAYRFDPYGVVNPSDMNKSLEERQLGGLGVWLALNGVDRFVYEYTGQHNHNIFVVNRSQ